MKGKGGLKGGARELKTKGENKTEFREQNRVEAKARIMERKVDQRVGK